MVLLIVLQEINLAKLNMKNLNPKFKRNFSIGVAKLAFSLVAIFALSAFAGTAEVTMKCDASTKAYCSFQIDKTVFIGTGALSSTTT